VIYHNYEFKIDTKKQSVRDRYQEAVDMTAQSCLRVEMLEVNSYS